VGIDLSIHPQVSVEGKIQLSMTLRATVPTETPAPSDTGPSIVRTREVSTTVSMNEGETTLVSAMFRAEDFGGDLDRRSAEGTGRDVVVAIGASILRAAATGEALPLPMGTEERVKVREP
jgi:hypothetical protein